MAPAREAPDAVALAFEDLYRSSRDDVFGYVSGLLRDRSAAEDVTAQAFERAFRRRSTFDPKRGTHRAWLFGIARNAALDELRRRSRQAELAVETEDEHAVAPDDAAETALTKRLLRDAMAQIPTRDRELIALKYFAGLDNGEIARVIGTSETNAGTKLHRAMEKLRRACDDD